MNERRKRIRDWNDVIERMEKKEENKRRPFIERTNWNEEKKRMKEIQRKRREYPIERIE